jgi:hypothetical protein
MAGNEVTGQGTEEEHTLTALGIGKRGKKWLAVGESRGSHLGLWDGSPAPVRTPTARTWCGCCCLIITASGRRSLCSARSGDGVALSQACKGRGQDQNAHESGKAIICAMAKCEAY